MSPFAHVASRIGYSLNVVGKPEKFWQDLPKSEYSPEIHFARYYILMFSKWNSQSSLEAVLTMTFSSMILQLDILVTKSKLTQER